MSPQAHDLKSPPRSFSFDDLLAPHDSRRFVDEYRDRDFFLVEGPSDRFDSLFSLRDVDHCLWALRGSSEKRLTLIPPPDSGRAPRRMAPGDVALDEVYEAFGNGETVRIDAVQDVSAPLAKLCAHTSRALNSTASINLYLTPENSQGFSPHFDTHDAYVIQVFGAKDWRVYSSAVEAPVERPLFLKSLHTTIGSGNVENPGDPRLEARLNQGDLLYIPRGVVHEARTSEGASLHLTMGVMPFTWSDLFQTAIDRLSLESSVWRQVVPQTAQEREKVFGELIDELARRQPLRESLAVMEQESVARETYPPDGHFEQLATVQSVDLDSTIQRRVQCVTSIGIDSATVTFASNLVRTPSTLKAALDFIATHELFRVRDVPVPGGDRGKLVLVRRLIREGLLRQVSDDES